MAEQSEKAQQKKKAARVQTRKVKDKWKSKQWYTLRAPALFNEASLGETMSDDPEKLKGRIAEATLQDVTGDFSKMHVKCFFQVRGVRGTDAVTTFAGHDLTSDYVRRLVRRSHSKMDDVADVTTSDGFHVRLKTMIVTERRAQSSQQTVMRERIRAAIHARSTVTFNDLVRQLVQGDISKDIYDACRVIVPLKRVEVKKSEILSEPTNAIEILDVFAPPPAPPAEEEPAPEAPVEEPPAEPTEVEATTEAAPDGAEPVEEPTPGPQ